MPFPLKQPAGDQAPAASLSGGPQSDNTAIVKQAIEKTHASRRKLDHPTYFGDKKPVVQ